jgi:hypothetical protein
MGYGLAVPIIFWYVVIRVWILTGRKIPLIFIGLWLVVVFGFPYLHLPSLVSPLTVISMAIVLVLIDRYQAGLSKGL